MTKLKYCRRVLLLVMIVGLPALAFALPGCGRAQQAPSPVVGTWIASVKEKTIGELKLPNLVTFSADGTVTVAAPPFSRSPGERYFSAGQGAWTARGLQGADVVFGILVFDGGEGYVEIHTIRGTIEVDPATKTYAGQFELHVGLVDGTTLLMDSGTWQATRVDVKSSGPLKLP